MKSLATAIGELVWASNMAHGAFCLLFAQVVSPKNLGIGNGIWNTLKSDTAQRDVLLAAARAQPSYGLFSRIDWAMKKAGKLSSIRNDAAHTPIMFESNTSGKVMPIVPEATINSARHARLSSHPNIARVFKTAHGDFVQLGTYAYLLIRKMHDKKASWPKRPRLRSKLG